MNMDLSSEAPGTSVQTDYTRIRDLIRSDIVLDRLKSGSRLKISKLAARYSTSTVPVREALQQLQGEGIVTFVPNRGASVRTIDADFVSNIYEVRALIEPFLARRFVRHHDDGDVERLEAIQRDLEAAIDARADWHSQRQLDLAFHATCYSNHYNKEALTISDKHVNLLTALTNRFQRGNARAAAANREHWAMIAAVRAKDEAKMAKLMELHLRGSCEDLIERMKRGRPRE